MRRAATTTVSSSTATPLLHHTTSSAGPNFWKFAAFPLTLYIIEKAIRIRNAGHHAELKCLEVKKLADKVTGTRLGLSGLPPIPVTRARAAARHVTPYLTPRIPCR